MKMAWSLGECEYDHVNYKVLETSMDTSCTKGFGSFFLSLDCTCG